LPPHGFGPPTALVLTLIVGIWAFVVLFARPDVGAVTLAPLFGLISRVTLVTRAWKSAGPVRACTRSCPRPHEAGRRAVTPRSVRA